MKAITLLFGFIPLPGSQDVSADQLTHFLVIASRHNQRPWWKRLTRRTIRGYQSPFEAQKDC
ncbi:MAG: hypothetical protein J0H02_00560 [Armatimonadetes bacterium]|nr:hypothetical protein [Armatimonadota bacterium]